MDAGTLTSRITLRKRVDGQDELGQPLQGWQDVATVWADIRHLSGVESIKAGAQSSTVRASIRIRYRQGVTAAMRAVDTADGTTYDIKAAMPDKARRVFVDLACEVIT